VVIFDRSWYNRAGVEYVMGFCSEEQYRKFLQVCPKFEKYIVDAGIILIKYWLEVGKWKLSPMDLESFRRWYEYSLARDAVLKATDTKYAPWYLIRSDDKRRARLNCVSHLLGLIPYKKAPRGKVKLPKRSENKAYDDQASLKGRKFISQKY
jgi:polyphosphate kinase 2 (PPK2 family)